MHLTSGKAVEFFFFLEYHKKQPVLASDHSVVCDLVGGSADSVRPPRASSSGNAKGQAETHKTPVM